MQTLVIIPSLMHKYTFSAPLAWLFSRDVDKVRGIYSDKLNKKWVQEYDSFIVELNWFIELYEFGLIIKFIRRYNRNAKILFGGLYSQLKYTEIFERHDVDYFIKGDAELPISQYLNGARPEEIPNMVGRNFVSPQTYHFTSAEYADMEFNLDWLPDFQPCWDSFPEPEASEEMSYKEVPRYPRYHEAQDSKTPLHLRWRVPSRGGRYHLPMLFTGRGGCPAAHDGCDYCMGAKHDVMRKIYGRQPVTMSNADLIMLLQKIEKKFDQVSLYINSDFHYDLRGHSFDLDATIEIDCNSTAEDASRIFNAFRKTTMHVALFEEGITGARIRTSIDDYMAMEDADHKMLFFAMPENVEKLNIPPEKRLYTELVFPDWTDWKHYTQNEHAEKISRKWYAVTGQTNLYPPPKKAMIGLLRPAVVNVLWALQRTGLMDRKRILI